MKSGTAQKLVLNMISTTVMIQLGRVEGNRMVNMQLSNEKLVDRGVKMLMEKSGESNYDVAKDLLLKYGSGNQLTVTNFFSQAVNLIEQFQFSDGVIWNGARPCGFKRPATS
jgi:N-acetylmuramic acid 6-phosphate (MurNAc-6-P) etherase